MTIITKTERSLRSGQFDPSNPAATGYGDTLFVASTGGHLEELKRLSYRFDDGGGIGHWATFADAQSDSLLRGERVHHLRYVPPRGYRAAAANVSTAVSLLRRGGYRRIVSTGAGVAIPFLLAGRSMGLDCHYVESAARTTGPSLTGSVAARIPGVRLYTQYEEWASSRWHYRGSVFDTWSTETVSAGPARRVVVTLGTMRDYGFRSAVDALLRVLPEVTTPDAQVLWQVGSTDVNGRGIEAHDRLPADHLRRAMSEADLVVAHAGVGSALNALDSGNVPVLLPRLHSRGEHVDDHQQMIARRLADRRLAVTSDPAGLTAAHLREAMSKRVHASGLAEPFRLRRSSRRSSASARGAGLRVH